MKKWFAEAPANIALIKYMGKKNSEQNTPINSSLSYTLDDLKSFVEMEATPLHHDSWEPLDLPGRQELFNLPSAAQIRFLQHLARLKTYFKYTGHFIVRSCNNFPASTGLASSASSFAALTRCAVRAMTEITQHAEPSVEEVALLSQQGSGSSCRSFFRPWALWSEGKVTAIELPIPKLIHQVVVVTHTAKKISSSEAHQRITTSPAFENRPLRAEQRLYALLQAFKVENWDEAFKICWDEFTDMHRLFATSQPAFSYMTATTETILRDLQQFWEEEDDGPLVTLDAGPNIHLLYRPDQADLAQKFRVDKLLGNYDVIS